MHPMKPLILAGVWALLMAGCGVGPATQTATEPTEAVTAAASPRPAKPALRAAQPVRAAAGSTSVSLIVVYGTCDQVRAAGGTPLRTGDAGFNAVLDTDGDGIDCNE